MKRIGIIICLVSLFLASCGMNKPNIVNYSDMNVLEGSYFNNCGVPMRIALGVFDYDLLVNDKKELLLTGTTQNYFIVPIGNKKRIVFNLRTAETVIDAEEGTPEAELKGNYRNFSSNSRTPLNLEACKKYECLYDFAINTMCVKGFTNFPAGYKWVECVDLSKEKNEIINALNQNDFNMLTEKNKLPDPVTAFLMWFSFVDAVNKSSKTNFDFIEKVASKYYASDNYVNHNIDMKKIDLGYNQDLKVKYATKTMHDCAVEFDTLCIAQKLSEDESINQLSPVRKWTPLFSAVNAIRNREKETPASISTIKYLLENGADTQFRVNPKNEWFDHDITAQEFLTAKIYRHVYFIHPPEAPKAVALFSDAEVMKKNKDARTLIQRAAALRISSTELKKKFGKLEAYRAQNSFDGYAEAFLISSAKDDFNAAQRLATNEAKRRHLEYLAVMATKNQTKIFDIRIKINKVNEKSVSDSSREDKVLLVLSIPSKTSSAQFKGVTEVVKANSSPVPLKYGYEVTVKHTLVVTRLNKTKLKFIITQTNTKEEVEKREKTFTYRLIPQQYGDKKTIDFGVVNLAKKMTALGGTGTGEITVKDIKVISEIISVKKI